jgi:hypothetical protein
MLACLIGTSSELSEPTIVFKQERPKNLFFPYLSILVIQHLHQVSPLWDWSAVRPLLVSCHSLNAFITNALSIKKASYSLSKRLSAAAFHTLAKTHLNAKIFSLFLYKIDRWLYNLSTILLNKTYTQKNCYSDGLYSIAKIDQQLSSLESTGLFTNVPINNLFFSINFTSLRQT